MDKKVLSLSTSVTHDDNNIASKLRRLRIQEALLLQSVQRQDKTVDDGEQSTSSSYKELLKKVKNSFINIKNLYDELKANTQSQELLADMDIDDIKKKVFELDSTIKTYKSDIHTQLAILKQTEHDLNKQFQENPNEVENLKRRPKTHSVNFNAIVPSPVRAMMTSPFKCLEVQQFQEFMKNSPNRYGGWNEYNHNLFVKQWQKCFGNNYCAEFECDTFEQSVTYIMFIEDLMTKLQGITLCTTATHVQWYIKYLYYKEKQQNAIDKWKWSKTATKKVPRRVMYADEEYSLPMETTEGLGFIVCDSNNSPQRPHGSAEYETKTKRSVAKEKRPNSILKPTKQWLNRYQHDHSEHESSSSVDSIELRKKQLHTPHWRLEL